MLDSKIFLVADISGYTEFMKMHAVSVGHAEGIVGELVKALVKSVSKPLTINKLEGDALFAFANIQKDSKVTARETLENVHRLYVSFVEKKRDLIERNLCMCDACKSMDKLELKFVLHHGSAFIQKIGQFRELSGVDVIITHRLLKNSVESNKYVLLTSSFHELGGEVYQDLTPDKVKETYDFGEIDLFVYQINQEFINKMNVLISHAPPLPLIKKIILGLGQFVILDKALIKKMLGLSKLKYKNIPN